MSHSSWSNDNPRRIVVIEGTPYSGLFFYAPTPAAGNLVGSWAAQSGTDPYGNAYPAGIAVYNGRSQLIIEPVGDFGVPEIIFKTGATTERGGANIVSTIGNSGAGNQYETLQITSASDTAVPSFVEMFLNSAAHDGSFSAGGQLIWNSSALGGTAFQRILWGKGPTILNAVQSITAAQPGTSPSTNETWHAATLLNGWANTGGSDVTAQYRMLPNNTVEVIGSITGGTNADTTVLFTLPAGYLPAHLQSATVWCNNTAAPTQPPRIDVLTGGNVRCFNCTTATKIIYHATFPLDA
jgi:hypothetical protein